MDSGPSAVPSGAISGAAASFGVLATYRQAKRSVGPSRAEVIYSDFLAASREASAVVRELVEEETREALQGPSTTPVKAGSEKLAELFG